MKHTLSLLLFTMLLLIGCGGSDRQDEDRADMLLRRSVEEMNRQNYDEAERLAVESITLRSEQNDEKKLADDYATLSTIQILSGKLSPALETLAALRELHRRSADRPAELQTMLQTAKIYFQLGKSSDAVTLLTEVHNNARLFRLGQIATTAALDLAGIHNTLHHFGQASDAAAKAYSAAKELGHSRSVVEALQQRIHSSAASGSIDQAFSLYKEAIPLVSASSPNERSAFIVAAGKAFSSAGEWSFAKTLFRSILPPADAPSSGLSPEAEQAARIGLGELYLHHYAFTEAQQHFVRAYTLARSSADQSAQSYLMIRVADCLSQHSVAGGSRDGSIRAEQLYEQAMTIYSRSGFPLGEALALHRIGSLKERNGDDNGALTFYKRAFDKFNDASIDPHFFTGSEDITRLMGNGTAAFDAVHWFSSDLILLLLKYRRTNEAYAYHQTARSLSLLNIIDGSALRFTDPKKERLTASLRQSLNVLRQNILEFYHASAGPSGTRNRNYLAKLQQQITYARSKFRSDAVTLAGEFPSFSFLTASPRTVPSTVISGLPVNSAAVDLFIERNQAWAFLLRPKKDLEAVKISSFGYSLGAKMERFSSLLLTSSAGSVEMNHLSQELYDFFLRPLDLSGTNSLIIIPAASYERFPFHALSDNGINVIERTAVSYVPHSSFIPAAPSTPKFINTVSAFGFTSNSRWGLEFELRDIRSFFRNIQVNSDQTATKERLESAVGEILQISSEFSTDADGRSWFALSDGTQSKAGVVFPVSDFTSLHPFKIVLLSDVRSEKNDITPMHPLLWLLNGSGAVIVNHYPIVSQISRSFSESFYASMSTEINPLLAYRRGVVSLGRKKELFGGNGGARYFYYGAR